ncbi:MAG: YidC/Oxa1 family membrane protein insertase [bacterium]|nr:YidC/Oxa1 family membrane protein insertase [bacterium]
MGPINFLVEQLMIPFLKFTYTSFYPNYGVAIILLTLLIKLIFYPLTQKQFTSMKRMQELMPEFKKIREKHKSNPQQLQQEMMRLYKANDVNPFGGCLPMIIQLPFLFAIFYTISSDSFNALISTVGSNPGFTSFWITNLAQPDPFYILPALIGLSTYLTQKLTPSSTDPNQAKIMAIIPIVMVFVSLKMPAGVLLYWATSQMISAAQQYFIMKPNSNAVVIAKGQENE